MSERAKTLGIVAHSAEGASLCFITACREGQQQLGEHMHPPIVLSTVPLALSMPGWQSGEHEIVARNFAEGVRQVADADSRFNAAAGQARRPRGDQRSADRDSVRLA